MTRPRAADDFATIRARIEELRRERECPQATESDLQRDPPSHRARSLRSPPSEIGAAPARVRQSGQTAGRSGGVLHFSATGSETREVAVTRS